MSLPSVLAAFCWAWKTRLGADKFSPFVTVVGDDSWRPGLDLGDSKAGDFAFGDLVSKAGDFALGDLVSKAGDFSLGDLITSGDMEDLNLSGLEKIALFYKLLIFIY